MRRLGLRNAPLRWLHLAALSAFAVAQPLFDLLARSPEFFIVRGSTRLDLIVLGVALVVVPPTLLLAIEVVATAIHRRAGDAAHLLAVAMLAAMVALQAVKRAGSLQPALLLTAAAFAGVAFAAVYARAAVLRTILTVLGAAPLLFLALFLVRSPVAELDEAEEAYARPAPVRGATPVVMVVFDEFPVASLMDERRRVDRRRYPNFAALASDSTWFRGATTVHEHTTEAVPAMLDARIPKGVPLPVLADHPNNLFTLLGSDYRLHVFEPVTQLCPQALCQRTAEPFGERARSLVADLRIVYLHVLLPDRLKRGLPSVSETWQNFGDEHEGTGGDKKMLIVANKEEIDREVGRELWHDQRAEWDAFVRSIRRGGARDLYFLHILLPHSPWRFLPSGRQYQNALGIDGLDNDVWSDDRWLVTQGQQRHLLQVGFVDRLLGRLLRRLRATGLYDRSLIVVTADHGLGFVPGEHRRSITPTNIGDIATVPLLVKQPRQRRPAIVDETVRTIDIVPTIADVLGIALPWEADGRSLLRGGLRSESRVVVHEREGGVVEQPADVARTHVELALAEKLRRFGSGARSLYRVGPNQRLLGRRLAALRVADGTASVRIDGATLFERVEPASRLVPSHVTGQLSEGPLELAIAVNGRICAVTRAFRSGGAWRFAAFVPESAFRPGENEVEVLAAHAAPGGVRLERLEGGDVGEAYALRARRTAISLPENGRARVVRGAVAGHVEDWFIEEDTIRFGGWAADERRGRLPDRVVVFADGRFLYAAGVGIERRDLRVAEENRDLTRSGFVFELPRSLVANRRLRFYAISGDLASELSYARGFPWRR